MGERYINLETMAATDNVFGEVHEIPNASDLAKVILRRDYKPQWRACVIIDATIPEQADGVTLTPCDDDGCTAVGAIIMRPVSPTSEYPPYPSKPIEASFDNYPPSHFWVLGWVWQSTSGYLLITKEQDTNYRVITDMRVCLQLRNPIGKVQP